MILKSFNYSSKNWNLDTLSLDKTNLIVGKNSAGKTRALVALMEIQKLLSQEIEIDKLDKFEAELSFARNEEEIRLSLKISPKEIISERLTVNGKNIIVREKGKAIIAGKEVNPPADKLLLHVHRDTATLPDIEDLISWGKKSVVRYFTDTQKPTSEQIYKIVSQFSDEMKQHVVEMANEVGFPLTRMDTFDKMFDLKLNKIKSDEIKHVLFQEEGVMPMLFLKDMSNGMQRTILMLIFIEAISKYNYSALIAIDDLGEGLDYERSTKLGKLMFETCEKNNVQLIATSNEDFLMNIIDIDKWNILVRSGHKVRSITSKSAPEVFKEFRFSGLNNFDFFTSDIFNRL